MSEPVISVDGLSKAFHIYEKPSAMVLEVLSGTKRHDTFWALKDVSFQVNEHDRVGIIGANGSGKTTLLKIITGNLQPTTGSVTARGRISAMLGLASSLNPEETGLSNIKFNLMLNGYPKGRIAQATEEIIEFTELGSFIYQPVKTYSTGMNAKLAFGIATAIEPEILIVDEVLSVGDGYFVSKAMKRMVNLCEHGKALLFVSHAISAVQLLCNKVVWLENGSIRMMGPSDHVLKSYEEDYRRREDEQTRTGNKARAYELESLGRSEDVLPSRLMKLRLVAIGAGQFHDTHYVRRIRCSAPPLQIADIAPADAIHQSDAEPGLDLNNSEWGRSFERLGSACRVLSPRTGKARGGQFVIAIPDEFMEGTEIQIDVESQSLGGGERLAIETLNYETGAWDQAERTSHEVLDGGWVLTRTRIPFRTIDPSTLAMTQAFLVKQALPQVEVLEADLLVDDKSARVLNEHTPFKISVDVVAHRSTVQADVCIKIMRSDGVYVFWQSSGMTGQNISDFSGSRTVTFDFSNNVLGAGSYQVSAYSANGWVFPGNYPYSEVFDRKVNLLQFSILPAEPILDFGVLNLRVPVSVSQDKTSQNENRNEQADR